MKPLVPLLRLLAAAVVLTVPTHAGAAHNPQHVTTDGLEIYYGVLPAAMVRGHEQEHGGKPKASGFSHVIVSLFDSATGRRISNAKVTALVAEIGLLGEEKELEPMKVNDVMTLANYFRMTGPGPYWIELSVRLPGAHRLIQARFEHRRP